jgi:hypothetical protein
MALDKLDEKLIDDIYLIPVLLDDNAAIPEELKNVQFTRSSSENCMADIDDAIKHQIDQLKQSTLQAQEQSSVRWSKSFYKDTWNGIPGFEIELQMINLRSDEYPRTGEIGDYVNGCLLGSVMDFRQCVLEPDPESYNYGQDRQRRTNTYDASYGELHVIGKTLSVSYAIHTYYARAAHPNMSFKTFVFMLEPLIRIDSLSNIFKEPGKAFEVIQRIVRDKLCEPKEAVDGNEEVEYELDRDLVDRGTENWESISSFIFKEDGIEILFDPYQVASYAEGPQSAEVSYSDIWRMIRPEYLSALDKEHLQYNYFGYVDEATTVTGAAAVA